MNLSDNLAGHTLPELATVAGNENCWVRIWSGSYFWCLVSRCRVVDHTVQLKGKTLRNRPPTAPLDLAGVILAVVFVSYISSVIDRYRKR